MHASVRVEVVPLNPKIYEGRADVTALARQDEQVASIVRAEQIRQRSSIVLIASENYASQAVMEATGSVLTNKYAEGYPGNRYYAGCEYVDQAEEIAIERAKTLFGMENANVQPHSGSQANMAACFAVLKPGDRVLSMALDHGGHLTHGAKFNFSGKLYEFEHYGVNPETECLDYEQIARQARKFKPKMIIAGYSAYSRSVDFAKFSEIAKEVGAHLMADISHIAGLIAGEVHPSPAGLADIVTSTTHKTLRGPRGAFGMTKPELFHKYNSAVFPALQGGPMMHTIAAKAVAFGEALKTEFKDYIRQVVANAKAMAEQFTKQGLRIVSGGTDTHLFLVDLLPWNMTGLEAEETLCSVGIIVNRNAIPFDPNPPKIASGIRIGTAAITTRGMKEKDVRKIADLSISALKSKKDKDSIKKLHKEVETLALSFSIPLPYN